MIQKPIPYIVMAILAIGCASLDISVEEKKSENYTIGKLSSHWHEVNDTQADHAYWSKISGATININSLCERYNNASLNVLSDNLLRGVEKVKVLSEKFIMLSNRKAKHVLAEGKLDGVAVQLNIYVLRKDFCLYDFTYAAPPYNYKRDVDDFEKLVKSFKTKKKND